MAFNLNEFKSKIDQYGGLARTNLFTMHLVSRTQTTIETDITFFCKSIDLPGIQLNTFEHQTDTFNMAQTVPIGIGKDQVSAIIMIDDQYTILRFFHEWMQKIVNYDDSNGRGASRANDTDHFPYTINYRDEYVCRLIIRTYSGDGSFYECILDDVFPNAIGSLRLSWEDNNSVQVLPVSFSYSSMKMDGTLNGSPGDLPYLYNDSGISNIFGIPNAIRDIRNRINNTAKNIKGIKTLFT